MNWTQFWAFMYTNKTFCFHESRTLFQERPYTVMVITGLLKYNVMIQNELTYLTIM
jgi:hypothetical protein